MGSNPTAFLHELRRGARADEWTSLLPRSRATDPIVGSNPTLSAANRKRGRVRLIAPASKADGSFAAGPGVRIPPSPQSPEVASVSAMSDGDDLGGVAQRQSAPLIRGRPWVQCPPPLPNSCPCSSGQRDSPAKRERQLRGFESHRVLNDDLAGVAKWQPRRV